MRIAFVWPIPPPWDRESDRLRIGMDPLRLAITRLNREGETAALFFVGNEDFPEKRFFCAEHNAEYVVCADAKRLMEEMGKFDPDIFFLHHNRRDYAAVAEGARTLRARRVLRFNTTISAGSPPLDFDVMIVDHPFQVEELVQRGVPESRIHRVPNTADTDFYRPDASVPKVWDCIYPARGGFGYIKRMELAVEACRLSGHTLVLPGATIPGCDAAPPRRMQAALARRTWGIWKRLAWRLPFLSSYPWVATLPWQTPEQMKNLYNQSRCLLFTTDDREMGPRSIPEAAACNLPFVCCEDSRACASYARRLGGFAAKPDPADLAEKIQQALSAPSATREALIRQGLGADAMYLGLRRIMEELA